MADGNLPVRAKRPPSPAATQRPVSPQAQRPPVATRPAQAAVPPARPPARPPAAPQARVAQPVAAPQPQPAARAAQQSRPAQTPRTAIDPGAILHACARGIGWAVRACVTRCWSGIMWAIGLVLATAIAIPIHVMMTAWGGLQVYKQHLASVVVDAQVAEEVPFYYGMLVAGISTLDWSVNIFPVVLVCLVVWIFSSVWRRGK